MIVYTINNTPLNLQEPPIASGGEGAVYEIVGHPNRVAKIYTDPADAKLRQQKITAMINISQSPAFKQANLSANIAWPMASLRDGSGNFIGFGMERIHARTELDDLYIYPPKSTDISINNRVNILVNLCDVIHRLHAAGQVFGDFNPNNIKVDPNSNTVTFVDADSYHIASGGKEYRCIVCAPGYVAPEVIRACHGTTYAACPTTTFTQYTDRFALAIHVFRMLMNGCHPFSCARHVKGVGSAPAPMPLDKRVEYGDTPFFKNMRNFTTPVYAPDINALPPYIRELFRKAFVDGHRNPACRPSAAEWKSALLCFRGELAVCNHGNQAHHYWRGYHTCPYCEAYQRYRQTINPSRFQQQVRPANNPPSPAAAPAPAPNPQPASVKPKAPSNHEEFSTVTVILYSLLCLISVDGVFSSIYQSIFDNNMLVTIGCVGSVLLGVVGCVLYNEEWSRGHIYGRHRWYDYLLSPLTAYGFALGFIVIMMLFAFVFQLFGYLLLAVLGLGALISICSG